MAKHDPEVSLQQMLDFAEEAVELAKGKSSSDIASERVLNLALVRLVELVGEAANRVPAETRGEHHAIPWEAITGMRNKLIHGYDFLDYDVLSKTVTEDLPALISYLRDILS